MNALFDVQQAFRQFVRRAVKAAPFTKGERDVTLALLNLWFYHRNGPDGVIYPGRAKLAKKAEVSVRTVASTLAMLREHGAVRAVAYENGGRRATRYKLRLSVLIDLCGFDVPEGAVGDLVRTESVRDCTVSDREIARLPRAKIAHGKRLTKGGTHLSQPWGEVITHAGEGRA